MGQLLNRAEKTLTHVGLEIQKKQGKLLKMKEEMGNVRIDVEMEKRENEILEMMNGNYSILEVVQERKVVIKKLEMEVQILKKKHAAQIKRLQNEIERLSLISEPV